MPASALGLPSTCTGMAPYQFCCRSCNVLRFPCVQCAFSLLAGGWSVVWSCLLCLLCLHICIYCIGSLSSGLWLRLWFCRKRLERAHRQRRLFAPTSLIFQGSKEGVYNPVAKQRRGTLRRQHQPCCTSSGKPRQCWAPAAPAPAPVIPGQRCCGTARLEAAAAAGGRQRPCGAGSGSKWCVHARAHVLLRACVCVRAPAGLFHQDWCPPGCVQGGRGSSSARSSLLPLCGVRGPAAPAACAETSCMKEGGGVGVLPQQPAPAVRLPHGQQGSR